MLLYCFNKENAAFFWQFATCDSAMASKRRFGIGAKKNRNEALPSSQVDDHIAALRAFVQEHKNKRKPARSSGKLRVFADCAGIGSETIALGLLGFREQDFEFVGGTEIDSTKRCMLQAVHKAFKLSTKKEQLQRDIFDRSLATTSPCDVYIAGFPCPAYSNCGKKLGARDGLRRGLLLFEGLKKIAVCKPGVVILEQVVGFLQKKHHKTHQAMKKKFRALNYVVYMKKMQTMEHGIPQSRRRCYFVAFHKTHRQEIAFRFPKPLKCPRLSSFLDTGRIGNYKADLASYEERHGASIWNETLVLDIGASPSFQSKMHGLCPCLIRTRCKQKGYYLPKQRRLLDGVECARFQGVPAELYRRMLSNVMRKTNHTTEEGAEKQIMGALGDSMSVNVLMRILPRALKAASLWPASLKFKDPWAESSDLASLSDRLFEAAFRDD